MSGYWVAGCIGDGVDDEMEDFFNKKNQESIFGTDEFKDEVRGKHLSDIRGTDEEVVERKRI